MMLRQPNRMEALAGAVWALAVLLALLFVPPAGAHAAEGPPPAATAYRAELLRAAHSQWGLDAPVAVMAAQVHQESGWNPQALSRVGAAGMAQFMPATAAWWCKHDGPKTPAASPPEGMRAGLQGPRRGPYGPVPGARPDDTPAAECQPTNPVWALRALAGYDKFLFDRLAVAGPAPDRLWAALRAYNGGLGHWLAEAKRAASFARVDVDAACGSARRAALHCPENLTYPRRIMVVLQPRYSLWGGTVTVAAN